MRGRNEEENDRMSLFSKRQACAPPLLRPSAHRKGKVAHAKVLCTVCKKGRGKLESWKLVRVWRLLGASQVVLVAKNPPTNRSREGKGTQIFLGASRENKGRLTPWFILWLPGLWENKILLFLFYFFYCSGFCHTLKWNSHGSTCVPHPEPPFRLPLHPIPLSLPSAPALSTCLMHPTWAGDLFHPR